MGAWSEQVMCNDYVLDEMWDLTSLTKSQLRDKVREYLCDRHDCIRLFGIELVDISINGIDEDILGGTYDYDNFFNSLKGVLNDYKDIAIESIEAVKDDVINWTDTKRRHEIIKKIELRLTGNPSITSEQICANCGRRVLHPEMLFTKEHWNKAFCGECYVKISG